MKKNILKLFYIPIIGFLILTIIYFGVLYNVFMIEVKKNIFLISQKIIKDEKQRLKDDVNNFKYFAFLIKKVIYSSVEEEMRYFLSDIKENRLIITNKIIFGKIPYNKKFKYSICQNKYIVLNLDNKKYLVVFLNRGKNVYIAGILKSLIDDLILDTIIKYLDHYNKNRASYIALGKITTFNPKDGVFGYVYYMPSKLKFLEGKNLNINSPDIKGNYFRKKYFECLKHNKSCFVKYYFENPETGKIEEKISYFSFFKDYNLSIVKGIYKSQIKNFIKKEADFYVKRYQLIFILGVGFYVLIFFIFGLLLYLGLRKIKLNLINQYETMEKELKEKYYYDSLTKLPNRFKLVEDISKLNANCIVILDIRDFGVINELYGFEVGNEILRYIARILKKNFNNVYKFGNDEFAIICDNYYNNIGNILKFKDVFYKKIKIDFNIGISLIKPLIETAEIALYKAKSLNKFIYKFEEDLKEEIENRYKKIQILKDILKNKNIIPFYQCIVDRKGRVVKYESLMRLKDNKGNILSPFMFMDEIKQAKLYV